MLKDVLFTANLSEEKHADLGGKISNHSEATLLYFAFIL